MLLRRFLVLGGVGGRATAARAPGASSGGAEESIMEESPPTEASSITSYGLEGRRQSRKLLKLERNGVGALTSTLT